MSPETYFTLATRGTSEYTWFDHSRTALGASWCRIRQSLGEAKATLVEVHDELQAYTGLFDLPDPDDDLRTTIQRIIDNEVKHVPMR